MPMPKKPRRNCKRCGTECSVPQTVFCSSGCCGLWKNEEAVRSGKFSHRSAKNWLLRKNRLCQICKNEKWMGKEIPLILDHIDGIHENNQLDNLRLVCGNCDMQLPTYKKRNNGKGRKNRRDRYRNGLSY